MIDKIIYINLEYRTDRKISILSTIEKAGFDMKKVHRIDAVLNEMCGHIGCGESHIKALQYAIKNNLNCTLILEDDFVFTKTKDEIQKTIAELEKINWDCVLLAQGHKSVYDCEYSFLKRVKYCTTTSGYIVKRPYFETLLNNFTQSVETMKKEYSNHVKKCIENKEPIVKLNYVSAIDQYWRKLQVKDIFYLCQPVLGEQIGGYSDNNCSLNHQREKIKKHNMNNSKK